MNRQQAIELAQKIKAVRKNKFKGKELNFHVLLRLSEMSIYDRDVAMERLVEEGYADSVGDVRQMLKDKRLCLDVGIGGSPTESSGMSDSVLDAGIQYLGINQDLF